MDWEIYERWEPSVPERAEDEPDPDTDRLGELVPPSYGLLIDGPESTTRPSDLDVSFPEWTMG